MYTYNIVLNNLDPKNLHQQITQLESIQDKLLPDDSIEAVAVSNTVKFLHGIEDEVRKQARAQHPH
jgi:hypothetical protein